MADSKPEFQTKLKPLSLVRPPVTQESLDRDQARYERITEELQPLVDSFEQSAPKRREYLVSRQLESARLRNALEFKKEQLSTLKARIKTTQGDLDQATAAALSIETEFCSLVDKCVAHCSPLEKYKQKRQNDIDNELSTLRDQVGARLGMFGALLEAKGELDVVENRLRKAKEELEKVEVKVGMRRGEAEEAHKHMLEAEQRLKEIRDMPHTDKEFLFLYEEMRRLDQLHKQLREKRKQQPRHSNAALAVSDDDDDFLSADEVLSIRRKRRINNGNKRSTAPKPQTQNKMNSSNTSSTAPKQLKKITSWLRRTDSAASSSSSAASTIKQSDSNNNSAPKPHTESILKNQQPNDAKPPKKKRVVFVL